MFFSRKNRASRSRTVASSSAEHRPMLEDLELRLLCSRAEGVDVASFQGTPTWSSVYSAGKRFVIAKATEGTGYTNPDYTQQIGATSSSLVAGAYHFSDYGSATAEADHFYAAASGAMTAGYLRPTLDIEGAVPTGWTSTTVYNWVNNFGNEVAAKSGSNIMVYTSQSYAATYFNASVTQWNFWIAHYNGANSQTGSPGTTTPFSTWNIWQYSSTGAVSGISGNVDLDVANGTMTGYVLPTLVQQHGSKFVSGQAVHVNASAPSGLKAWDTYTSNGTFVTEPQGKAGTIESDRPVFIDGFRRWEVLYSGDSVNRWSAEDYLT